MLLLFKFAQNLEKLSETPQCCLYCPTGEDSITNTTAYSVHVNIWTCTPKLFL